MTILAANSFSSPQPDFDNRDSIEPGDVEFATHLAQLQRTGNLTDWKSEHADIQLLPSACTDCYTNLVLQGNQVPLLPADDYLVQYPPSSEHTVMGTRHKIDKLRQLCSTLEAETTAGNQAARYKLFLAAGFVVYQVHGETKRAPILLIPATIERVRGRASDYAIQYQAGKQLHLNPHIADMCSAHIDQSVNPFENTNDLREFLRGFESTVHQNFKCKITANTGLISLHADTLSDLSREQKLDIELERTKPGAQFTPMPATPESFDPQLALRFLRFIEPAHLNTALRNFSGQKEKTTRLTNPIDPTLDPDFNSETLERYHNCAGWLVDVGLGDWKLENIAALPRRVQAMETSLNDLLGTTEFNKYFRDEYKTVDTLVRLNQAKDTLLNAPPEMRHHAISAHADSNTRVLLQQAKIQASSLQEEMAALANTFQLQVIPNSQTLIRLIEVISKRESEPQLDNPDYFRARRTLNELLGYQNGVITEGDLERLSNLAKTLQFSETFNNDPYYKRNFGSLFKGTDTNWQRLDAVITFNHALALELGSSMLVAQFTDEWVSFERDFSRIAPLIESAASDAHKLCSLIPMFIEKETTLENASRVAEKYRCRIDVWQKYLRKHLADAELTPMQLLSNMELGEHSYPTVNLSQHKIDERIYRHIAGQGLSDEAVAATSGWLMNVIVTLQTDTATVRRFLDKEAVLHRSLS